MAIIFKFFPTSINTLRYTGFFLYNVIIAMRNRGSWKNVTSVSENAITLITLGVFIAELVFAVLFYIRMLTVTLNLQMKCQTHKSLQRRVNAAFMRC